jgi:hypothetical protein
MKLVIVEDEYEILLVCGTTHLRILRTCSVVLNPKIDHVPLFDSYFVSQQTEY